MIIAMLIECRIDQTIRIDAEMCLNDAMMPMCDNCKYAL